MEQESHMTVAEAAKRAGFGPKFIYAECEAGRLPHYRHGWQIRIDPADFKTWLASRRVTSARGVLRPLNKPVRVSA